MLMKFFSTHKFTTVLTIILTLATLLRFSFLSVFPPSMLQDEVGIGYSAISIAQTGMDEWGEKFPLIFKSFGDFKAPGFIYATALLYKIIGWHEVLPRITSAIAGVFIVLLSALWIRKSFKSDELGLIAGFLVAVSPWNIHLSRMALESNLGLAFFIAGLFFIDSNLKSKYKIIFSALFFSLSTYTFHSFRYIVVLYLLALIAGTFFTHFSKLQQKIPYLKNIIFILTLSTILSLPGFLAKGATGRLNQTLIITSSDHIKLYEHYENNCHGTFIEINPKLTLLCKLKYNKFTRQALIGTESFVKHFSPDFLFFSGDTEVLRNPTQKGQFFVYLLPFWMIGSLLLLKNFKKHYPILLGYILALVPSAVSGNPHATRLSVLIPFVLITFILGYQFLTEYFKNFRYFSQTFVIVTLLFLASFSISYTVDTFATHEITSTYLSYAKKVALLEGEYIQKGYTVYADHDLYPEPHLYYAYFNHIDPRITQESFAKVYEEKAGFSRPKQFGDTLFFEKKDISSVDCELNKTNPTVFFTNDSVSNLTPVKIIKDNTHLYSFVYIYEGSQKCIEE